MSIKKVQELCIKAGLDPAKCIDSLRRILKAKNKDLRCDPLVELLIEMFGETTKHPISKSKSNEIINYAIEAFEQKAKTVHNLHVNYLLAVIKSQSKKIIDDIDGPSIINQWGKTI